MPVPVSPTTEPPMLNGPEPEPEPEPDPEPEPEPDPEPDPELPPPKPAAPLVPLHPATTMESTASKNKGNCLSGDFMISLLLLEPGKASYGFIGTKSGALHAESRNGGGRDRERRENICCEQTGKYDAPETRIGKS